MTLALGLMPATRSTPRVNRVDEYEPSSGTESSETPSRRSSVYYPRPRNPFIASSSSPSNLLQIPSRNPTPVSDYYRHHPSGVSSRSVCSTATNTPLPSRSASPLPHFLASGSSSACTSDSESEPYESASPLLGTPRGPWWREDRRRWWMFGTPTRRRRRRGFSWWRRLKRGIRKIVQHPLFPSQPITIILTLLLLTILGIFITLLLIHILNPDKEPLPWRVYCSTPSPYNSERISLVNSGVHIVPPVNEISYQPPSFPPDNLDLLPPAGILIGVFSLDSSFERRMLVRSTWASHPRSREGALDGDGGNGTSRTIVRFILGQPSGHLERRIRLEMETYNDIIILPISENMNSGKTYAFFTWASNYAYVPPYYFNTSVPPPNFSYSNFTSSPSPLAKHDPLLARQDSVLKRPKPWVRPDFVVKTDDDSFVMLAELEARLRVELYNRPPPANNSTSTKLHAPRADVSVTSQSSLPSPPGIVPPADPALTSNDPMVYWGYLVKHRFMAGELYALSWTLVDWVARDPVVRTMTSGAEDKQTAKWMEKHPRANAVRWRSEHCWIYDHPRAGTVYSHGFLFPSEATRVKESIQGLFRGDEHMIDYFNNVSDSSSTQWFVDQPTPAQWAHSSVSTFNVRYTPPVPDLTVLQSVEALVEGSDMSSLREGSPMTPEFAWTHREGRRRRYENKRVGGTVVVHFVKKHVWWLETAYALLEGPEKSEAELQSRVDELEQAIDWDARADSDKATTQSMRKIHKLTHSSSLRTSATHRR
ncbi:glycosyltransferase family 31 protein [Neolentinus lepideus HHB14362 ss-1]|uniref:Glycosyltransferase family 31 protein n=1 Tax=Neolentinus lepideus HHB14362 ss-1 TaxID=1314782 RepID=A0A165W2C0_9AGAM|nr:glycosyltransferase family 31 protein [Neolentinus lepideus HHB14362 ss-1]